jgi:hypothetical protein
MLRTASVLLSALLLSACVTNGPSDVVFPAAATPAAPASAQASPADAEPAPAAQAAAATPAPAARGTRAQPAGRATRAPAVPEASSSDDGPFTITKAREQCWMASETDKTARADLDKKVKWVEQCVDKKMNASIGR